MKRFTKICLILAAVLTALGMIGVGVGFLLGAKPEQLAGNLSYTAPSLSRSHGQNKDSNSGDSSEYTYDSAIRRLELDVHYASVTIGTSEDDHISVKARNAGKYFKESVEDGDMLVLEDERPKGKATLELEILLPDRVLEEMELDLGRCGTDGRPASGAAVFPGYRRWSRHYPVSADFGGCVSRYRCGGTDHWIF